MPRTIRQVIVTVQTNKPIPEDARDMDAEQDVAANITLSMIKHQVDIELPPGYFSKVEFA